MKLHDLIKTGWAAILITVLAFLPDLIFNGFKDINHYAWLLLANLLVCVTLGLYVLKNRYTGKNLLFLTFIVFYTIGYFNILIEALIFHVTDRNETLKIMMRGIPFAALTSFIIIVLLGKWKGEKQQEVQYAKRKVSTWIGKILAGNFLYFVFYMVAGMLFQMFTPRFDEFYQNRIPPFLLIILTNMFFRGFIFVAIAILIDRTWEGTTLHKALLTGLIFSVIGGIAPLIPPNEFMPAYIRIGHGIEVGISNFLYGICVLLIIKQRILPKTTQVSF